MKFVPGDLVVARSVVIARFCVYKIYMPMRDDRKWWYCGETLSNSSHISVTDRGIVSHSESGSNRSLQSKAVWQAGCNAALIAKDKSCSLSGYLSSQACR